MTLDDNGWVRVASVTHFNIVPVEYLGALGKVLAMLVFTFML